MEGPNNLKILAKLHAIMEEVEYIQKDATNTFSRYNYASERAIKTRLHAALVHNKVLFQLNIMTPISMVTEPDKGGKPGLIQILPCEYIFWDVESGECFVGNFIASGHLRDEKGTYGGITGGLKYILTT